jgi:hypothetical protein
MDRMSSNSFALEAPSAFFQGPAPVADGGPTRYALVKSGPDVPAEECERPAASIELVIRWGASVLHVAELSPPRSFYVGEDEGASERCDYPLPAETLGRSRAPIVTRRGDAPAAIVILPGMRGTIELAGQRAASVDELLAAGLASPSLEVEGAHEIALPHGSRAALELGGVVFEIATGNAGRAVAARPLDAEALPYHGASLFVHAALLATMAALMPPLGTTDSGDIDALQAYELRQYLQANAEK